MIVDELKGHIWLTIGVLYKLWSYDVPFLWPLLNLKKSSKVKGLKINWNIIYDFIYVFYWKLVKACTVSEVLAQIDHKGPHLIFLALKMTFRVIPHISYLQNCQKVSKYPNWPFAPLQIAAWQNTEQVIQQFLRKLPILTFKNDLYDNSTKSYFNSTFVLS